MKIFKEIPKKEPRGALFDSVDFPEDLRKLDLKKLPEFCDELREQLLYSVGQTGGHFGGMFGDFGGICGCFIKFSATVFVLKHFRQNFEDSNLELCCFRSAKIYRR